MAIGVDENIRRLKIPVYHISGVQILDALHDLIHDEPMMYILEYLLADGVVQIRLHVLKDEIEIFIVFCADDVE